MTSLPTNHLDLRAKDVLLESLEKFSGTVVFVSHDRYFIDKLATRVFEIGDGRVQVFPGNYEDYLWRKQGGATNLQLAVASAVDLSGNGRGTAAGVELASPAASALPEAAKKRVNPIKLKQMKDRCRDLEKEVARLEAAIAQAEAALQNFVSAEETQRQTELLNRSRADLESSLAEWGELAAALETSVL